MIVSNKYTKIERNGMYYIIPSSAPECPHCGGAMTVRDSKRRKLILSDGTVQMFVLLPVQMQDMRTHPPESS